MSAPPAPPGPNVYAGIFADETGQQLLTHSMAQIHATLGTAWRACEPKEGRLDVFGKCMDLVDTWNEKTFEQESAVFAAQPRAADCWRASFTGFVTQVYRSSKKMQVRATVPSETAYVQALLTTAAAHPDVRSGRYFTLESSLERKDLAMELIRRSVALMCDEFVLVQEVEEAYEAPAHAPPPDVGPDDSASQAGRRDDEEERGEAPPPPLASPPRSRSAARSEAESAAPSSQAESAAPSSASPSASPSRSAASPSRAGHRSVTVMTQH